MDAKGRKTRQSNYGQHVVLVAPGEDIWTSNSKGDGVYASGTSFAAPFATAALALVKANGQSIQDYIASLGSNQLLAFEGLCQ